MKMFEYAGHFSPLNKLSYFSKDEWWLPEGDKLLRCFECKFTSYTAPRSAMSTG
jgi:hypothetical protein